MEINSLIKKEAKAKFLNEYLADGLSDRLTYIPELLRTFFYYRLKDCTFTTGPSNYKETQLIKGESLKYGLNYAISTVIYE